MSGHDHGQAWQASPQVNGIHATAHIDGAKKDAAVAAGKDVVAVAFSVVDRMEAADATWLNEPSETVLLRMDHPAMPFRTIPYQMTQGRPLTAQMLLARSCLGVLLMVAGAGRGRGAPHPLCRARAKVESSANLLKMVLVRCEPSRLACPPCRSGCDYATDRNSSPRASRE